MKLEQALKLHQRGDISAAQRICREIIELNPNDFNGWHLLGLTYYQQGDLKSAIELITKSISFNAHYAPAYFNLGCVLQDSNYWFRALESYDKAIGIEAGYELAYLKRIEILVKLNQMSNALACCNQLITLKSDYHLAFYKRAEIHLMLNNPYDAILDYEKSIELQLNFIEGHFSLANAFFDLRKFDLALIHYQKAIAIDSNYDFLFGFYIQAKMKMCLWEEISEELLLFEKKLSENRWVTFPFIPLNLFDRPNLHQQVATAYVKKKYSNTYIPILPSSINNKKKIRIGYFSADFRIHPTSQLIVEILRSHDRSQFEVYGLSYGPENNDSTKQYISTVFDKFIEVASMSDEQIVQLSKDLGIDIAIDLCGHTQYARTGVFMTRCAPVQINYLVYPGTIGSNAVDYIMGDTTVIHEENQEFFSEKKIYLPRCYVTHDSKNIIPESKLSRRDFGLANNAFIFCCFNSPFKILPKTFDIWMRILKSVEGSMLWLLLDNPFAVSNLLKEAQFRGVDPSRLVFAKRMDLDQHLARHRLADLFLDTLPYNAHTTANDSLWSGLPVLTLIGQSFASRVAASLLKAIELPELICHTQAEYEIKAIELALNPQKLADLKRRLASNKSKTPLFDGPQITRNIESAYLRVYKRYQEGLVPEDVFVSA
ncbi:tetratricopeptide repeat protein [Polynucleobacter sp. AP-Elch-400A-B2]|uniref:O-linked N-acetylglucosamine transferase, SPINDLY family protein n=1 Tax=Polynucleobacter sp. AP-Elch-400A-B2 TaxID=2576930 RepID=UPI001BFD5A42|nr:tetratricopeptide repeat protein [Polynucleobacter sp. AP-Elch-400A-B2]QWE25215.1 tetratricopeptide repeat protein [Polynucleobacter sp. AP-Elch-400A-B2]